MRPPLATLLAAAAALAASTPLLPWATTGHRTRSGYELAIAVRAAGLDTSLFSRAVITAVLMLPLLAAVAIAGLLVHLRVPALVALAIATMILSAALWTVATGSARLEYGVRVTAVLTAVTVVLLGVAALPRRSGPS